MPASPQTRIEQLDAHRTSVGTAANDADYRIILHEVLICALMRNSTKDRPAQSITLGNKLKHEMIRDICLECIDYLEQDLLDTNSRDYSPCSALRALNGIGQHAYLAMKDAQRSFNTDSAQYADSIVLTDDEINRFHARLDRIDRYDDM